MFPVLLYWGGSIAIVLLTIFMIYCCAGALGWLPARLCAPFAKPHAIQGVAVTRRETLFWFVLALFYQWVVLFFAYVCVAHTGAGFFQALWSRFTTAGDSPHYLWLAQYGYTASEDTRKLLVFYPLYPLLIRLFSPLFGGNLALCGMGISQVCFAGAAALFRRLTAQTMAADAGRAATAALLLYPFSYFVFGVYTEGLFLLLSIACLSLLGRQRWLPAGLCAFLGALCRTQGLALLFPCLFAWFAAPRAQRRSTRAWALLGAPAGYGCYLLLNWVAAGQWMRYLDYQRDAPWYNSAHWFGDNLVQQYGMMLDYPGLARFIYIPQLVLYAVGLVALFYLFWRGTGHTTAIFSLALMGMSYLHGWLISGSRYMFGCLGLYLALGSIPSRPLRWLLLGLETCLLGLYAVYYMQGQAIM